MSVRFLLDTNTLSDPGRAQPNPTLVRRLREHEDQIATATPAFHELLFGIARMPQSRRRRQIEDYVATTVRPTIPILAYDTVAAQWHAAERARLVALGRTPPFIDGQIAAIAVTNGLVLVTSNTADFQQFSDLELEDWRE